MGRIFYLIFICFGLSCLAACNPQPEAPRLLAEAERLVESNPDSAMLFIDSISYPDKSLGRAQYMQYLVTRVQVYYKNYRDISGDTLVFDAARYYAKHNKNPEKTALSQFYSGCVLREQKRYEPAMKYYKDAEMYAAKSKDNNLRGLIQYNIGDLFAAQGLYAKAVDNYKAAVGLYADNLPKQANALSAVGRMFLLDGKSDSAFVYFHQGLDAAIRSKDNTLQSLLEQNLSVAYQKMGNYEEAEKLLREAFLKNTNPSYFPYYYLNLAKLYTKMEKSDSTEFYTQKLEQNIQLFDNNSSKASAYQFLSKTKKEKKEYEAAFDYQNKYIGIIEEILQTRLQQSVYAVQQKYDYEKFKNSYQQTQNNYQIGIILLLLSIVIGGTLFTGYTIRQKNRIIHIRQYVDTLQAMAYELNRTHEQEIQKKDENLRELLLWKFDVVKKATLLNEPEISDKNASVLLKKFRQIVYDGNPNDQWDGILSVFNEVNEGLAEKIEKEYPELSEPEYRITLLTYAGLSVKEIAVILHFSSNTVQAYRTSLRKKIGLNDFSSETKKHLRNLFND